MQINLLQKTINMRCQGVVAQNLTSLKEPIPQSLSFCDSVIFLKLKQASDLPYFMKINNLATSNSPDVEEILKGNRQVRPKMITKLLKWMERLCKQTLNFSQQTLEISSRILIKYLSLVDEPVCNLQLLGCTCLYLSSKIYESTVVAAQSYAECSCNIFTKQDLMKKQAQIYKKLDSNTNFMSLCSIYQFIKSETSNLIQISDEQEQYIQKIITYSIKEVQLIRINPCELIFSILYLTFSDYNTENDLQQIKTKIIQLSSFNVFNKR